MGALMVVSIIFDYIFVGSMAVILKLVISFFVEYKHTTAGRKSQCAIMTNIGEIATGHNFGYIRKNPL